MIAVLGLIGGLLFAYAALPAALRTLAAGRDLGTPIDISFAVCLGSVVQYAYLILSYGFDLQLFLSYLIGVVCWSILFFFGAFRKNV